MTAVEKSSRLSSQTRTTAFAAYQSNGLKFGDQQMSCLPATRDQVVAVAKKLGGFKEVWSRGVDQ